MDEWERYKGAFAWDGSLRDLYVRGTNEHDRPREHQLRPLLAAWPTSSPWIAIQLSAWMATIWR
jgi:hypothetical protein